MYLGVGYKPPKEGVEGLFAKNVKMAQNSKPTVAYVPLPSNINAEEGQGALDNVLKDHPYLSGPKATQVDTLAFEGIKESPSYWKFKVCYIRSLSPSFPNNITSY